jgi:hypothetical protein
MTQKMSQGSKFIGTAFQKVNPTSCAISIETTTKTTTTTKPLISNKLGQVKPNY